MITVWSWHEAPESLKAFSEHGGDEEHVILATGKFDIERCMAERVLFDTVIDRLDVWDFGGGTVHTVDFDGEPALLYITAHA